MESPYLPYARHEITEDDIAAVVTALRSEWLTTGPKTAEFEAAFAAYVGAQQAVVVNSGTAGLHAAVYALGIGSGDEVITTPLTFVASANCILYVGATPVFADVDAATLTIDPEQVEAKITPQTKAILSMDYGGQPCDYAALLTLAQAHGLAVIDDAAHALGAVYRGSPIGSISDLTAFSFHPAKHITTGEGGMVTTDSAELARRMRVFRNHGITSEPRQRSSWLFEQVELGYNYRLSDVQCALGLSQLQRASQLLWRRQQLVHLYRNGLADVPGVHLPAVVSDCQHAYHLFVVQVENRDQVYAAMRRDGIGVNVHHIPVHLQPYYRQRFGFKPGDFPVAEKAYDHLLTLPLFPTMTAVDVSMVVYSLQAAIS